MSKHYFSEIIKNEEALVAKYDLDDDEDDIEEPCDSKGYGLLDWLDNAVVGWDDAMQTYFVQLQETEDNLAWWIGTSQAELPTFNDLCTAIKGIFANTVNFEFKDAIEKQ